jgi:4-amino-4-deoxy-L-arabinose transferase-like glycosyltransferase
MSFGRRLALITAAGAALRVLYLLTIGRDVDGYGDWHFYHWQAGLIADGRGFLEPYRLLESGLELPSAGHPPLYPLALSVVSLLGGDSELAHRFLGVPLGAATLVLLGLVGRRIGGPRLGLVAAALGAGYPLLIAVDGALMSETLFGPLVLLALLAGLRLAERPTLWRGAALGAVIALAALTRAEALLLLPFLAFPLAFRARSGRAALGATVALVLVLAPWTIRNLVQLDTFAPISTNDATVLAGANCPLTYSGVDLGGWQIACISKRRFADEAKQAKVWREEAVDYAFSHKSRWPAVIAVRVARVWDLWQPRRQVMFAEGRQRRVEQAGVVVYFGFLVLGALGLWALRRRPRVPGALLVLLVPAGVVVLSAITGYGVPRLRHLFEPGLVVLAAAGLLALLERFGPWRAARGGAVGGAQGGAHGIHSTRPFGGSAASRS